MAQKIRAACLQMSASSDLSANMKRAEKLLLQAVRRGARFAAFPENFAWRGPSKDLPAITRKASAIVRHFQTLARRTGISVLLGSILEPAGSGKCYNTSVLISEKGKVAARYRKIHLFGIGMKKLKNNEGEHVKAGKTPVTGRIFKVPAGLSVCYDLRFPELYRSLAIKGAKILLVPANFTAMTGKAHWETLLRARAIENQAFVIAPGQTGKNPHNKITSHGNSVIIDPWGTVLIRGNAFQDQVLIADLDLEMQAVLRREFPVLKHRILSRLG